MTVFVTGSAGFIGTNLLKHLELTRPAEKIVCVQRTEGVNPYPNLEQLVGISPGALVHLAGKAHDLSGETAVGEYDLANFELTRQVFDQFMSSELDTFVFVSSVKAVSEGTAHPLSEGAEARPGTPYGRSKLLAEDYIRGIDWGEKKVYILRLCMTHGPENRGNLNLLKSFVNAGLPNPLGKFENLRSILCVDNLLYVFDRILYTKVEPGLYHVADDDPLSTNQMIEIIAEVLGKRSIKVRVPRGVVRALARLGDALRLPINTHRLTKLTEDFVVANDKLKLALAIHQMPISVEEGLRRTIRKPDLGSRVRA